MKRLNVLYTLFTTTLILLYANQVLAQFGDTHFEVTDINKEMEKLKAKREAKQRIIEHNEWVRSERNRLNNGKQTGIILMITGGVISCIGGGIQLKNSNKHQQK